MGCVEVLWPEGERAGSAAGGLDVQPEQQAVEAGVVAGGGGYVVDLVQSGVGYGAAGGGESAGFGDFAGWVVGWRDQSVVFGVPVEAAECCDQVFAGASAAACVAAGDHVDLYVLDELLDL